MSHTVTFLFNEQVIVLAYIRRLLPVKVDETGAGGWSFRVEFSNGDHVSSEAKYGRKGKSEALKEWEAFELALANYRRYAEI